MLGMTTFTLDPLPKIITFDCYGTIVQWHEVLLREISKTREKQSDSVTAEQPYLTKTSCASALRQRSPTMGFHRARLKLKVLLPRSRRWVRIQTRGMPCTGYASATS